MNEVFHLNDTQAAALEWRSGHDDGMPSGGREDNCGDLPAKNAADGWGSETGEQALAFAPAASDTMKRKKAYTGRIIMD